MSETSLGKLQKTVDKQETEIVRLKDLVRVRKERYRLLQMNYKNLEKIMDERIEKEVHIKCNEIMNENDRLKEELLNVKRLLNIDSNNSGMPTTKTPLNKSKRIPNTREKSSKKIGGQEGHCKSKLHKFDDEEITDDNYYEIEKCTCGGTLEVLGERTKDELDIEIRVKKTRHHFMEYKCSCCGRNMKVPISNDLKEENQYGSNVKAVALSLLNEGAVSYGRTRKLIQGFSSDRIDISEGYLVKLQRKASVGLERFINELKQNLIKEKIIHWDDTVIMIDKKRGCLRFYGTDKLALFTAHEKKNKEGINEDSILKLLTKETVVVHDHNCINYNEEYEFENAECCVHLLRDLEKVNEELSRDWCRKMATLLKETNDRRKEYIKQDNEYFEECFIEKVQSTYDEIIEEGNIINAKHHNKYFWQEEKALLNRLAKYKDNYLMWVIRFDVPFSNNLSERSLRSSKTKMKVSGQFKNIVNAEYYARLKSYIESCKRNNINVHEAIIRLVNDNPYTVEEIFKRKSDE